MFTFRSRGSRSADLVYDKRETLRAKSIELARIESERVEEQAGTILCTTYFDIALFPKDVPDGDVPVEYPDSEPTLMPWATTPYPALPTLRRLRVLYAG